MAEQKKDHCIAHFEMRGENEEGCCMIVKHSVAFYGTELGISRTGGRATYRFGKFLSVIIPEDKLLEIAELTFSMMSFRQKLEFLKLAFEILNDSSDTPEMIAWYEDGAPVSEHEAEEEGKALDK